MQRTEETEPAALAEGARGLARDLNTTVRETQLGAEIKLASARDAKELRELGHPLNGLLELEEIVAVHRVDASVHLGNADAG